MSPHAPFRLALALLAASAGTARAADPSADEPAVLGAPVNLATDIVIELGAGARLVPTYEGSGDDEVTPFPIISLDYLNIPGLVEIGGGDGEGGGLSVGPSFGYVGERNSDEHAALDGLDDVDATYQAGVRMSYEWTYAEIYGEARYAFGGADGVVGDVGANLIARPAPEIELKAGPVVSFASGSYMDSYFGVTAAESLNTGGRLDAYNPDGGLKTAGVSATARYEFQPDWFVNADATYNRFVGDAKDSPVVQAGSEEQVTVGLGLSKRFSLDLF